MFRQVVGTILRLAAAHPDSWLGIRGSHDVPAYGFERIIDPPPLEVNAIRLLSEFHNGSITVADVWRRTLPKENVETVLTLATEAGRLADAASRKLGVGGEGDSAHVSTIEMAEALGGFHFPDDLWARPDLRPRDRNPHRRASTPRSWSRPSRRSTSAASGAS